jgi:uncharacterized protein (TIGR02996 family)
MNRRPPKRYDKRVGSCWRRRDRLAWSMTSVDAFLRSIAEDPGDRTTLLVFADWLEDQDDPLCRARSELLRIQTALAGWVADVEQREHLQDREQQLLLAHQEAWLQPLLPFCQDWRFVLGLPQAAMEAEVFLSAHFAERGDEHLRRAWVKHLRLKDLSTPAAAELAEAPYLQQLSYLDLSGNALQDDAVAYLARSPHLAGLTALDLSNNRISEAGLHALRNAPNLGRLLWLGLRNNQIRNSPLLFTAKGLPRLRELDLDGNDLDHGYLARMWRAYRKRPGLSASSSPSKYVINSLGMKLVLIPAGSFCMGSPESEEVEGRTTDKTPGSDERPQHKVTLTRPFYLGIYPVTQRDYAAVMSNNPAAFRQGLDGIPYHPIETVTWDDAVRFCDRLSELPDEMAAGRKYRLPTEGEWEYACRAGSRWAFSWGNAATSFQANFDGANPYGKAARGPAAHATSRVGCYPPNPLGLYDMHGNVWEWCQDWYEPQAYSRNAVFDPAGPRSGNRKAVRGGAWSSVGGDCRSACRDFWYGTSHAGNNIGFRVVMTMK